MAVSYSAGVATITGGSRASPELMSNVIDTVAASDATKAYRSGLQGWLNNVTVRVEGWVKIDNFLDVAFKGSSYFQPVSGSSRGIIHGQNSCLRLETSTARVDEDCDIETGMSFVAERDFTNGTNPKIYYTNTARHDYPTILRVPTQKTPNEVDITGLDFYYNGTVASYFKIYFGLATTVTNVNNIRFYNLATAGTPGAEAALQYFSTTYNNLVLPTFYISAELIQSTVTYNNPVMQLTSNLPFQGSPRDTTYIFNNITYTTAYKWNGAISCYTGSSEITANSEIKINYSNNVTFSSPSGAVNGATCKFYRTNIGTNNYSAPNSTYTTTTNSSGYVSQSLMDGYYKGTNQSLVDRYNWSLKIRGYASRTNTEYLYQNRVYDTTGQVTEAFSCTDLTSYLGGISSATAAALSGISISGTTITVTGTRSVTEIFAYYRYWISSSANMDTADVVTFDGTTLTLNGWTLAISGGNVTDLTKVVTGTVTITSSGVFEDSTGARWDVSGTTYYAKHVYRNVKALTGGANQQYAVCACIDSSNNDRTYNTSRSLGGLTTDSSGNVEGYYVYKIGSTTYTINEQILAYGFDPYTVPLASNGTAIGSSGSYDTARLVTDAQVTLSRSAALAISGITVSTSTDTVDLSDETFSVASDNLKARQANTSDIETGVKGYLSYPIEGRYLTKADSLYSGKSGWKYTNSVPGGTFKTGILDFDTTGTFNYAFDVCTLNFATAGSYNLAGSTFAGAIVLTNSSGGSVTVELPSGVSYTNTGPSITVIEPQIYQSVTITGLTTNSRVQIYDTTSSTELFNGVVAATSKVWTDSVAAAATRAIRVRISYVSGATAKEFIEANIGTCGITEPSNAISYLASQTNDVVYNSNAVDGSTITGITINDSLDSVQIAISGGSTTWKDIYAYQVYWLYTSAGIVDDGAFIEAVDQANYKFTGFTIKNTSSGPVVPLVISGGYGVDNTTLASIDILDTTGGTIVLAPDHVVSSVVTVSGVNVITGDIADVPTVTEIADGVWSKNVSGTATSSLLSKASKPKISL